ncbi:protein RKD4 [Impatiens glandulifera]|uniref:protein RKD4 n=1 Tax=Impatiens glandulifera TaxID=253017 RepID=UPI001FB19093|nr:protein RKD4 [Impatiens glandulifera]
MDGKQLDMVKLEKQNDSSEWIYFDPGSSSSSNSSLDYYHYYDHHHHNNFQFDPFTDFQWEFVDFPVLDHNNFQTKDKDNNNSSNNKNVHEEEEEEGGGDDARATTKMKMKKNDGGRRDHQLRRSGRRSSKSGGGVELEEIQKYFDVPITKAAKELKIGLTVLKKRCRELNIMRWPHRKIKSLNSLIHNFKELGMCRKEIEMLEHHKRMLEKKPELDLTDRTKRLRQACFKLNYKKRHNSLPSSS